MAMNPPHSKAQAGSKIGSDAAASRLDLPPVVLFLAYLAPILYFAVDFAYYGPVVRFGPFIAWVAAALGMAGFGLSPLVQRRPFLSGLVWAFVVGGAVLAVTMFIISLPFILLALVFTFFVGAAVGFLPLGTALVYGRKARALLSSKPRTGSWAAGLALGLVLFAALPILMQSLHERYFAGVLAGLSSNDRFIRSQTLKGLVGSRFCWSTCVRAVCEARAGLDNDTVKQVLAVNDADLACDEPGIHEWPG